jgi:16S rRNA G1207 methylase RsmC
MKYPRHHTIDHYLNKVRKHTEPYVENILGKEIIIFPNVMSPKYDRSSQMMIGMMPTQINKYVLDIGCGTGILSLFCAFQGANDIVSVDVNENAISNSIENFKKYNLINIKVFQSDLFDKVTGTFDTIMFNAPFHGNKARDVLELGTSDYNYLTLYSFFASAKKFLKPNGEILLGFANTGDNNLVKKLIEKNGMHIKDFKERENGDWVMYLYTIV